MHQNCTKFSKVAARRVTGQRGRWRLSSARHSTREMSSHRRPLHPPPHRTLTLPPPRPRHTHVTAGFEQWQVWLPATVCTLYRVELKNCCNTRILPTNRPPTYDPLLVCPLCFRPPQMETLVWLFFFIKLGISEEFLERMLVWGWPGQCNWGVEIEHTQISSGWSPSFTSNSIIAHLPFFLL